MEPEKIEFFRTLLNRRMEELIKSAETTSTE